MATSRAKPSKRYRDLLALYCQMHAEGERDRGRPAAETFSGSSLLRHIRAIRGLIQEVGATSLLDYGCGKAVAYQQRPLRLPDGTSAPSLTDYWGLSELRLYDPAFPPHAERPTRTFDQVICTDVLEHCPEEDMDWILAEIFGFARRAVFLVIGAYPAKKSLPTGENAHITQHPPAWWLARIGQAALLRPGVRWVAEVDTEPTPGSFVANRFASDPVAG